MKKQRLLKVILNAVIIFTLGICYALWCEHVSIHIPCIFNKITGLLCPGCGITRMCISLLKFDFASAFYYNKAIFLMLPYLIWITCKYTYIYIYCGKSKITKKDNIVLSIIIVLLIAYAVVRNIVSYYF